MKTTSKKSKRVQWAVLTALVIWGFISFLLLISDEDPTKPMNLKMFFALKLLGALSLVLCYGTGYWLSERGYIPEIKDE